MIFTECWECGDELTDSEFPVCDRCVLGLGPSYPWCCGDDPKCDWNRAFWGRWMSVATRRALPA